MLYFVWLAGLLAICALCLGVCYLFDLWEWH